MQSVLRNMIRLDGRVCDTILNKMLQIELGFKVSIWSCELATWRDSSNLEPTIYLPSLNISTKAVSQQDVILKQCIGAIYRFAIGVLLT